MYKLKAFRPAWSGVRDQQRYHAYNGRGLYNFKMLLNFYHLEKHSFLENCQCTRSLVSRRDDSAAHFVRGRAHSVGQKITCCSKSNNCKELRARGISPQSKKTKYKQHLLMVALTVIDLKNCDRRKCD